MGTHEKKPTVEVIPSKEERFIKTSLILGENRKAKKSD
jgi:hypothetical protein